MVHPVVVAARKPRRQSVSGHTASGLDDGFIRNGNRITKMSLMLRPRTRCLATREYCFDAHVSSPFLMISWREDTWGTQLDQWTEIHTHYELRAWTSNRTAHAKPAPRLTCGGDRAPCFDAARNRMSSSTVLFW